MSWATAMIGVKERLQTVPDLPIVKGEPHVQVGFPTSKVNDVLVFFWFDRGLRPSSGQVNASKYIVGIRVCVPWQDNTRAEEQIAPFVNAIPAVFDGPIHGTLGGRVNIAQITDIRSGENDGFINIGGTDLRSILFELTVTDKSAVGSGL